MRSMKKCNNYHNDYYYYTFFPNFSLLTFIMNEKLVQGYGSSIPTFSADNSGTRFHEAITLGSHSLLILNEHHAKARKRKQSNSFPML